MPQNQNKDKLTSIRLKQPDGTYGPQIPVSAKAENVQYNRIYNVKEILGDVNTTKGPIQEQIDNIQTDTISQAVSDWMDENATAATSVVLDKSLTIQNEAADAKAAGKIITINSEENQESTKLHFNTTNNVVNLLTTNDIDTTLTISGAAADAKVTGDKITETKDAFHIIVDGTEGLLPFTKPRIIGSNGIWTQVAAGHISIEIDGGDTVNISVGGQATIYAFLISDNAAGNTNADFSQQTGYNTRFVLNANSTSGDITAPSDANFLYLTTRDNNGNYIPIKSVIINGVERWYNIRKQIDALGNNIDAIERSVYGTNGITDYFDLRQYTIASNGKWSTSTARHISIPVNPGDSISLTGNPNYNGLYAALKSDNAANGVAADFCANTATETWQERKILNVNTTVTFTASSDCNILFVLIHANNSAQIATPVSIKINGVEYNHNIRKWIGEIQDGLSETAATVEAIDNNNSELSEKIVKDYSHYGIWGMRGALDGEFTLVTLPAYAHLSGYNLPLYTDGYKFVHNIDLSKYMNVSTNIATVHNSAELATAVTAAVSGDTIILDGGMYTPVTIDKSINLIGRNKPIFENYVLGEFTSTATEGIYKTSDTYSFSHSAIYDISRMDKGLILPLTQVANVSGVGTPGTYRVSNGYLYIHLFSEDIPTNKNVIIVGTNTDVISLNGDSAFCKWYLEGITVFGGKSCLYAADSETYTTQTVIGIDCGFYYSQTSNTVFMRGVDAYFQRCITMGAYLDGFNYHETTDGDVANGFEVDCVGHDNGARQSAAAPSNNGSTMHDGGKIIRINGLYYNNNGGNVADASPNTESYNYGCVAFDSKAPYNNTDETSADFWVRYANMYLYGCRAVGDSQYNLRTYTSGNIYVNKTEYDSNKTTGNITSI